MPAETSKRPRLDDAAGDELEMKDIQDEEIWMQDGNIIIAAVDEAKNERRLFKCHRGLLSSRLPVLQAMFEADLTSGSVTAAASEHYEDTPIVRLYDDPKHIRQLLHVLYNPSKMPYKWWLRQTMEELVGLMRLSRKYEAEDLYNHCVSLFQVAWPHTLKEWDQRNQDMERVWNEPDIRKDQYCAHDPYLVRYSLPDPGMAVAAADEHDLKLSCATALYALNEAYRANFSTILDFGVPGSDRFPDDHPADIRSLSAGLLRQLTNGRELIRCAGVSLFSRTLPRVVIFSHIHEEANENCDDAVQSWWDTKYIWATKERNSLYSIDPLGLAKDLMESLDKREEENEEICEDCRKHLQRCLRETREYIWEMLPAYFQVHGLSISANLSGNTHFDIAQRLLKKTSNRYDKIY